MKKVKILIVVANLACALAMSGCGTALFFPVKPAEKAADKVIDDIWPDVTKPAPAKVEAKKS